MSNAEWGISPQRTKGERIVKNKAEQEREEKKKSKIVYWLDWESHLAEERVKCVRELEKKGMLDNLNGRELDEVANYLLYSRDVDCQVALRKPSKTMISFEGLNEMGIGDKVMRSSQARTSYKTIKQTMNREENKHIPGMIELWKSIDEIKEKFDYVDDCLKKRREIDPERTELINSKNHYFLKQWYISLCLNQYALRDSYSPTSMKPTEVYVELGKSRETGFGISIGGYVVLEDESGRTIDLTDKRQLYQIMKHYKIIKQQYAKEVGSDWAELIGMIDEAIALCDFSDHIWMAFEGKVNRMTNKAVCAKIFKTYGIGYSENYISTLFTKRITDKMVKAVLALDARENGESELRKCKVCKEWKFEDEFGRSLSVCRFCRKRNPMTIRQLELWEEGANE